VSLLGLGVITGWVVILTLLFNLLLANRLTSESNTVLHTRAITVAATLLIRDNGITGVHDTTNDAALDSGIWIYSLTGTVERPHGDRRLQAVADAMNGTAAHYQNTDDYRLYSLPVLHEGRRVGTIVASVSRDPYDRAATAALVGSATVAVLVLLGAYPVLRLAAGRALRPVDEMTRQAADWSANAVTERFGGGHRYREIQTLAATLDGVLDRLAAVIRHERQLSAELSHELRTPLARVVAETDLLLARPHTAEEVERSHRAILENAHATERILETLLAAGREDLRTAPGRCAVASVIDNVRAAVGDDNSIHERVDVGDLVVGVDAGVLERVLAPILDNARRYARSSITITARQAGDSVLIDVSDDGPGVPVDLRESIFEPGFRGERDDQHDGAGLGLALARRLARSAAGELSVVGTGSTFRLRLPPA